MGEEYTSLDIAAALLKMIMEKENESFDHNVDLKYLLNMKKKKNTPGANLQEESLQETVA